MSQFNAKAVSTHALVLNEWLNSIDRVMAGTQYVYDEGLSVDNALTRLRAAREREGGNSNDPTNPFAKREFPLLTFKRGALKYSENGIGRRSTVLSPCLPISEQEILDGKRPGLYKVVHGVFPVDFIYYTDSIEEIERFEVEYLSEFQVAESKELSVGIPDLGNFSYYLKYQPLTDFNTSLKDMNYKAIVGSVEVSGFFFSINGSGAVITEIDLLIKQFNNRVLSNIVITPQGTTYLE